MQKDLVSVIVPVYNAETYLEECIKSLLNQTYSNLELILINDGSTDQSGVICKKYEKADHRVLLIEQKNSGVSYARNVGIERANGKFLCFADADDLVHEQMIEILMNAMPETNKSIACCYYQPFQNGEKISSKSFDNAQTAFLKVETASALAILNDWRNEQSTALLVPWAKIYSKDIFRTIRYPLNRRHEDELISHYLISEANNIYITEERLYYYRQHSRSFMNLEPGDLMKHEDLFIALEDRVHYFALNYPELLCGAVHHLLRECNSFYNMMQGLDGTKKAKNSLKLKYRKIYKQYWMKLDRKEKITGGLFSYFPALYHLLALLKFKG